MLVEALLEPLDELAHLIGSCDLICDLPLDLAIRLAQPIRGQHEGRGGAEVL
jgi:hypothetical protein